MDGVRLWNCSSGRENCAVQSTQFPGNVLKNTDNEGELPGIEYHLEKLLFQKSLFLNQSHFT